MRPSRRQLQPFTRGWSAGRPSFTVLFIALHTAAFVAQFTFEQWQNDRQIGDWLGQWLALSDNGIANGRFWQFLSFITLHDSPLPLHLLGNMLVLYFAGREVEPIIGSRHFLGLYLFANVFAGVAHWLAMPEVALVGVTAGVCALLAAYATILPELEITWHLFFVLPLRLRAKHLGLGLVVVSTGLWVTYTMPEVGPVAMLVGTLFGWIYAKQLGFGNPFGHSALHL
jgi:membrane associated rhomboid family serine protease